MNLKEIRKMFVEATGRYDLVVDAVDFGNNGADFYIQEGQRSLERRINVGGSRGKVYKDLVQGDYLVTFKNCRAITEVWVMNSENRIPLPILDTEYLKGIHQKFVDNMYTTPLSTMTQGRPTYCYATNLRRSPDEDSPPADSATLQSYLDTTSPYDPTYNGLILLPPCDGAYSLEIAGLFYNSKLEDDGDEGWWSIEHPQLLVMSAMRSLEILYKGSKSAQSWSQLVEEELLNIEKDFIEQEISQIWEMNG